MSDYLMRDQAPFGEDFWKALDDAVTGSARSQLAGRRFISLVGPLGVGATSALAAAQPVALSRGAVSLQAPPTTFPLPTLSADFSLAWRQLEATSAMSLPTDLSPAMEAAIAVAGAEDELILNGDKDLGVAGLFTVEGKQSVKGAAWGEGLNGFNDILTAYSALSKTAIARPYVLVLSVERFTALQHPADSVELEIDRVKRLVDGVFVSPALDSQAAALVGNGAQYLDLVIGQDLITAYLGPSGMDHIFRVLESLALRIKKPQAICVIG